MNGWQSGLHIRGLDRGDIPTADYLCPRCGAHKRVTGRAEVAAFTATDPATDHAKRCPGGGTPAHPDRPAHPTHHHTERRPA